MSLGQGLPPRRREKRSLARHVEKRSYPMIHLLSSKIPATPVWSSEYLVFDLVLEFLAASCHLIIQLLFFFFVSDAAGIAFDRDALEHVSSLDDATAAVEDRCDTAANSLAKAKEVLRRFYKEVVPKGDVLEDVDALADALSEDAPAAYKRKKKGIGASMGLAMAMASGAELDLPHVTSQMLTAPDGSEVAFALFASRCKRYGPKLIDLLAEYVAKQQEEAKSRHSGFEATPDAGH